MTKLQCKICSKSEVTEFIDFGPIPLGNAFPRNAEDFAKEKLYPLKLGWCSNCLMVQQTEPPPTEALHEDYSNYSYVPVGSTLDKHYADLAEDISRNLNINNFLTTEGFALDIGSNDGRLLRNLKEKLGCRILGVEPAIGISKTARDSGIPTLTEFYTDSLAHKIVQDNGKADLVTITQVMQHIPDLNQFIEDVKVALEPKGVVIIEGRYWGDTLLKRSYDTVYHEMMWFTSLSSLSYVLWKNGLSIFHAERNTIYGGSLRVYARRFIREDMEAPQPVLDFLHYEEKELAVGKPIAYTGFATDVEKLRDNLHDLIFKLRSEGSRIAGYGAPSTSATLLSYSDLTYKELSYVVDDSPLKQNKYTPGTHIPITSSPILDASPPDYLILLAWRLRDEILAKPQIQELRRKGMKILVPLPHLEVL